MAALTRTYDPQEGPILNVTIAPQGSSKGASFPLLLDTGADGSSVSLDVIRALALRPIGRRATIASGGRQASVYTYLVDISILFDDEAWVRSDLEVAEFHFAKPSVRGLLGRDILCLGDFQMNADHTFRFRLR